MSVAHGRQRREAIHRALAQRAGEIPEAPAVAEATLGAWHAVRDRLSPVIGARGVDVLFGRALHLMSSTFPSPTGAELDSEAQLARLVARLAAAEPAAAMEAGCGLLLTFVELLESLIGESLTELLLAPVWAPPPSASEKGNPP